MYKPKIGITIGDVNGIGPEVIIKMLSDDRIFHQCTPIIYGSSKVISYHKNIVEPRQFDYTNLSTIAHVKTDTINILNCWSENVNITLGEITEEGGKYAILSLEKAFQDLKNGDIDAVVTAPIHKQAMAKADFGYPGHTEFITQYLDVEDSLMCMVRDDLRVGLVTNHLPVKEVSSAISKNLLKRKINIMNQMLVRDFGLEKPLIAILGLNPHAGDGGVIGDEDEKIVRPAVIECKKGGNLVFGPFAADGFFGSGEYKKYDGILAMYHDQGLVPFKLMSFGKGVNFTAGLPVVRTSPDHGTGFDIVGQSLADPQSIRQALYLAIDTIRNRKRYKTWHDNPLQNQNINQGSDEFDPSEFED